MFGCSDPAVYIPVQECDACETFASEVEKLDERLSDIEDTLDNLTLISISATDVNNNTTTINTLAQEV